MSSCRQSKRRTHDDVMSVCFINYHNENIANIDKPQNVDQERPKRYNSRFSAQVREELRQRQAQRASDGTVILCSAQRHDRKTMGVAELPLDPPQNFLRKHSGVKWLRLPEHKCERVQNLPPLPRLESSSACCATAHRHNFIRHNIESVRCMSHKPSIPRYIDTAQGSRHELLNTGLVPQFVHSARFGKVPHYIKERKQQMQQFANQMKQRKQAVKQALPFGVRVMEEEERRRIIYGLKTNYSELTKAYQKLSLFTDTVAKKQEKTKIENQLRQLEQDILLMDRKTPIYVSIY